MYILKKSEFLDIALIRDVRTGKYANVPKVIFLKIYSLAKNNEKMNLKKKDRNTCQILMSGKSNAPINEKTITIYYGPDFVNLQTINFVSLG